MAKGSKKKVVKYDKDQSGCMWGLINIFDFRHGRPSQKLLTDKKRVADKKRGNRRIAGATYPSELKRPEDLSEVFNDADVDELCEASITEKLSVKELMEEEMFDNHEKGQIGIFYEDPKVVLGELSHGRRKNWLTNEKSLDLSDDDIAPERPIHRKHKSLSSVDVTGMMAELSSQVNVNNVRRLSHEQACYDISIPHEQDPSVTEESLGEATKVFVSHFIDGKSTKDSTMQPSRELMDALQVLNSNKDMFLKLLKDPDSQLVKHIEKLEDYQVSVQNSKVVGSDFIDEGKSKHQSFFWRKFKGIDRHLSKRNEHSQDASTIVVLKPGQTSSQIPEIGNKAQGERGSYFFFTDFTRRLKLVMRRERSHLGNIDKAVGGENFGMASPSRDRFFVEKIPKSSNKKSDKAGGSHEATSTPEQRISDIYTEAKKHLAEIVGKGDVDGNLSRPILKSLGRIISYSDYSYSPILSPRKDRGSSLVAPSNEITAQQGINFNLVGSAKDELSSAEGIRNDLHVPKDECYPLDSAANEIHTGGDAKLQSTDESKLDNHKSLDSLSDELQAVEDTPEESEGIQITCLDVKIGNQPSSPLASSPVSSRTEYVEYSDATTDRSERPSPVSVLEPIFKEDEISPPHVKHFPVSELIQPRKIRFEEQISSTPSLRPWEEERNAVFDFVKVVVDDSGLTREQLLERFLFSEHLLDPSPSVFEQVDALEDRLCRDPTLLFDLVDEVLTDVCGRDFDGIPSLYTPYVQLKLNRKDVFNEVWEGVHSHLESEYLKPKIDQAVGKDFSRSWTWMDPRLDCERVGLEMENDIFKELMEDAVMSLVDNVFITTYAQA
ncbi:hypothetical protein V2J09_013980 [Rumex salicifolius]